MRKLFWNKIKNITLRFDLRGTPREAKAIVYYFFRHPVRFWRAFLPVLRSNLRRVFWWCWATLPRRIVSSVLIALLVIGPISFLLFKKEAKAAWPPAHTGQTPLRCEQRSGGRLGGWNESRAFLLCFLYIY